MLCSDGSLSDLERSDVAGEVKLDGTRAVLICRDGYFQIRNRYGVNYTRRLPEITFDAGKLKGDFILDGEVVYFDESGRAVFKGSQKRCATSNLRKVYQLKRQYPVVFLAFDIPMLNGDDLTKMKYLDRKAVLKDFLSKHKLTSIRYLPYSLEPKQLLEQVLKQKGEGIILKRVDSIYQRGVRSKDWLKVKLFKTAECLVVGYTAGESRRSKTFGSLVLSENGRYVGNVGSGFSDEELMEITKLLKSCPKIEPPFTIDEPYTAVKTNLIVQVRYFERTENGVFRHPSFIKPIHHS